MEQMRSEFEDWAKRNLIDTRKKYADSYMDIRTHFAWEAWQASRAAVEIKLPMPAYSRPEIQAVAEYRVMLCKNALRAAGLRVKEGK